MPYVASFAIGATCVALVQEPDPQGAVVFRGSADIYAFLREEVATWDREQFLTVTLGKKHKVIAIDRVSVGGLTASIVHPRQVFKGIVLANVAAFICLQNHPSGDPTPSKEACLPKLWRRQSLPAQSHLSHA